MPTASALSRQTTPSATTARVRIGIMGTPTTSGNRGVMALGSALVRLCLQANPTADVFILGSQRDDRPVVMRPFGEPVSIRVVPWRLSPRAKLPENLLVIFFASLVYRLLPFGFIRRGLSARIPWVREVEAATFVGDVRGGDSFSDIYGMKRFLIATLPILSVIAIKGSIVQFPQTYGPFRSGLARRIARFILLRSSVIIARDTASQKVAQDIVAGRRTIGLSPDVAFALHADATPAIEIIPPLAPAATASLIGVNINGLMFNGGYTRKNMFGLKLDYPVFVRELLITLLRTESADILLVPHTFAPAGDAESDNDACRLVRESLPAELQSRVHLIGGEPDAHELKGAIARCAFFVGSRMHSCIGALSQGVPCVGVAYSMKFRGVFESVGMGAFVIDARDTATTDAVGQILALYRERDRHREPLKRAGEEARRRLQIAFAELRPAQA